MARSIEKVLDENAGTLIWSLFKQNAILQAQLEQAQEELKKIHGAVADKEGSEVE